MGTPDKYFWTPNSDVKIEEYVKKFRPSIIDDHDTPWIWVQGSEGPARDPETNGSHAGALLEAKRILSNLEERIKEIEDDASIPNRAKKGQKSKKAVRDEAHDGAKESLKNLSQASNWTVGKWLLFPKHEAVDGLWSTIAQSVATGPLKDAGVFLTKVAPTPSSAGDFITHVICLYVQDIYDLEVVKKVCHTLLSEHGIESSAAKSDLYTLAGIDSNHPTKLRSSIWRPMEVIEGGKEGIENLKAEYHANKGKKQGSSEGAKPAVGQDGILASDSEDERIVRENKKKRKAATEEGAEEVKDEVVVKAAETKKPLVKKQITKAMKFKEQDIFAGGSDSE